MNLKVHIRSVLPFVLGLSCIYAADYSIEAEDMVSQGGTIIERPSISGNKSVLLLPGDALNFELCMMSNNAIQLSSIMYSNDGMSDNIQVTIDDVELATFDTVMLMDNGNGWSLFRSPHGPFPLANLSEGRHLLSIAVTRGDSYGVEIDAITIRLAKWQPQSLGSCKVFCYDDIEYHADIPTTHKVPPARAVQKSHLQRCAEVDNVNIPVFHDTAKTFTITASLPKYVTFTNNRHADWSNCVFNRPYWDFIDVRLTSNRRLVDRTASLDVQVYNLTRFDDVGKKGSLDLSFSLQGQKDGSVDSEIGTRIILHNIKYNGTITVKLQYFNRYDNWVGVPTITFTNFIKEIEFETPDFAFREGSGNMIKIELFSNQSHASTFTMEKLNMVRRWQKGDVSHKLYEDSNTIIEAVDVDFWWRINETMTITLTSSGETFDHADYFRIYRRLPWSDNGWSQIYVMYQDGNIRLLTKTPHGLDWIPFGSSVIVGQTDISEARPVAPIVHLDIDPVRLHMSIFYKDGGVLEMNLVSSARDTKLEIIDTTFARNMQTHPFFTFRSMYASDGDSDVDHVSVDGTNVNRVISTWDMLYGTFFAFYRKCISQHNTLSPDITLHVTS